MTDMQGMLFPPLDDEESSVENGPTNGSSSRAAAPAAVLPQAIKDRFSKVRSLLREKASADNETQAVELKRKQEEAALEAARAVQEEVQRLQNGIAELEAMVAVQQRQEQLQLQQQRQLIMGGGDDDIDDDEDDDGTDSDDEDDDGQGGIPGNNNHNIINGIVVFPALPSLVVNAVEPDVEGTDADNSRSSLNWFVDICSSRFQYTTASCSCIYIYL